MPDGSLIDFYTQLLDLNRGAFEGKYFSVAYHALAGALHCAGDAGDVARVAEVEKLAAQQLAWIDAHAPDYEHSSHSATQRGHLSIYAMLSKQAHARTLMLQRQRDREEQNNSRL